MRGWPVIPVLTALLLALTPAPAQETAPTSRPAAIRTADAEAIAAAILDLDADSFARRQAAMEILLAAGEAARAALREAVASSSLERSLRAQSILAEMGVHAASRPVHADATLITFQADQRPLAQVVTALGEASRYVVRLAKPAAEDVLVSVSWRETPFFQALDELARAAGMTASRDPRDNTYVIEASPEKPVPTSYGGPTRAALTMLNVSRQLRFGGTPFVSATLQLRIDCEDRLDVIGMMSPLTASEFVDDRGRSLQPSSNFSQSTYVVRGDARKQLQTFLQMAPPEPDAKAIGKLKFTVPLIMPEEYFEAKITEFNVTPSPVAGQGAFRVWIEEWREDQKGRSARIAVERPNADGPLPPSYPVTDDVVTFLSPEGTPIPLRTSQMGNLGKRFSFSAEMPPLQVGSIKITCLKRVRVVDVPCAFQDVPLP